MKRKLFTALIFILVMAVSASAFSGNERWSFKPDGGITSGVAVSGNSVLFGTYTGKCYAVNKNTGRAIWNYQAEAQVRGVPSVIGDKVVFATEIGKIICLSLSDGSLVWETGGVPSRDSEGNEVNDGLADGTTHGGGLVYVSKADRRVHAYRAEDGHTEWTHDTSHQGVHAAPTYSDGLLFVGEYNGVFSILDAKTGKRLNGGGAGSGINTPSVNGGNVYYSSDDGSLHAVKINGVEPLWSVNVHDAITTQPEVSNGKIIVGTGRGSVVALDEKTGRTLWRFNTNCGGISAKPILADGVVFASAQSGPMFVLDARTGKQISFLGQESGTLGNPAYSDGILYFSNGDFYAYE